jgi:lipoprotein
MKHAILIIGLIGLIVSCHYEKPDYYKGDSYVQMWRGESSVGVDSGMSVISPQKNNYLTVSKSKLQDTAWFIVHALGRTSSESRKVMFEQYSVGEESGYLEAVADVNFVPFGEADLAERMVVPADTALAYIPVVIKYDPDPKAAGKNFHLYLHLVPTEDFGVTTFGWTRGCVTFTNSAY